MHKFSHKAMDTAFNVSIASGVSEGLAASAAEACFDRIDAIERLLTRFSDSSDVAVIRSLKDGEIAVVSRETIEVLCVAAEVAAATDGAYDPALGKGFSRLVVDPDGRCVSVSGEGGLDLDFGGIGKGYALDECAKVLASEQFEISEYLLDAGTSTLLAKGGPWPIGVGGPFKSRTRQSTKVMLSDGALSGSGFEIQGAHIVDPRTGAKAGRWAQSWSRARTGAVADALSTAALSMSAASIEKACAALDAAVLVARDQPVFFDRFRDPLKSFTALSCR